MLLGDFDACEELLQKLLPLQPEDAGVKRLAAELARARLKHAAKSKRMGAKLLEAIDADDRPEVKAKEARKLVDIAEAKADSMEVWLWSLLPSRLMVLIAASLIAISVLVIINSGQYFREAIIASFLVSIVGYALASVILEPESEEDEKLQKVKKKMT
ncbi:unnamed protein product [Polarella glacialis]|uniref:Tetratricopeptide repeat protein n=1 Tax=Polarella glacialis TaxID=89957 RepID=A0A813DPF1_POLGL|nr:unnamed protein product [Polarella glacialis]